VKTKGELTLIGELLPPQSFAYECKSLAENKRWAKWGVWSNGKRSCSAKVFKGLASAWGFEPQTPTVARYSPAPRNNTYAFLRQQIKKRG